MNLKRHLLLSFLVGWMFASPQLAAQATHSFKLSGQNMLLDGKPLQIISGELHPARIPKAYWRHRIQMTKAMGCNTIAAYVFWNYHETQEGKFDFVTENRNIAEFVKICQQEGMWVMLRPGPYVCAEWDFGGLPTYLLRYPDIRLRCLDERYMAAVRRYAKAFATQVANLQISRGGPVLLWQVENEYGSFGNDRNYIKELARMWRSLGIDIPFYTADGPTDFMLEAGSLDSAVIGLDSGSSEADFELAHRHNPLVPVMSSETYPGWLTHWGEAWARTDTISLKKEISFLLQTGKSFNLYVIHGGTNFGFSAGANAFSPTQYQPDITSYDYDAPIDEQGRLTAKYYMLRNLIAQYAKQPLPPVPAPIKTIEIPAIQMALTHHLSDYKTVVKKSVQPLPFESFGQNQGIAVYRTKLIGHKSGRLKIWEPHDYALVYLDGVFIDTIYRDGGKWEVDLPKTTVKDPVLEIMVEGMGHINFAQFMIDRKGITDRVTLNGMTLMNWETGLYPMTEAFVAGKPMPVTVKDGRFGSFFSGNFELVETGDTYFDLSGYYKGMVYVNGHLLGRYWNIGPQQRLFCAAGWLKKGGNEIVVYDLLQQSAPAIRSVQTLAD